MEVTGTHIKRTDTEGAPSLVVLDRGYINRSGASTLSGLVKDVIYNSRGVRDETYTQGFAPASAAFDLRGLGVNRTLVLVNGRRVPLFPFAQDGRASFVDINLIPLGAVERIEILKDGASAIYGSDAIAGVVNIILRRDYNGAAVSVQLGETDQGDGNEGHVNLMGGLSNDKGNFTLIADYFDRGEIKAEDRDVSKSALGPIDDRSAAGNPGTIIRLDRGGRPIPDPRCAANEINPEKGPFCLYDFAPWTTLIPETQRLGLVASGDYAFTSQVSAFFGANYTYSNSQRDLAPSSGGFFVAPDNPNNIFPGEPVISVYRLTELGPRTDEFATGAWNALGGLRGSFRSWDWEFGVGGGEIDTRVRGTNGYTTQDAVEQAIDNGLLNPFGRSLNFYPSSISYQTKRDGNSSLFYTDLKATGELLQMPYGQLSAALGAEYRSEDFSDTWDPVSERGDALSVGGTSSSGDRNVTAVYAELSIPVLERLEMQLAGRYDDYSDFGGTFNPKIGLRWKALSNLLLRGTAGTGFKAPSLPELYSGEIAGFDSVYDPVQGRVTQVDTFTMGNPELDAEESRNYGAGLVWDVTPAWNLLVDYWHIRVKDGVSNDSQFYVNNEDIYPDKVIRGPDGGIVEVLNPFQNVAEQKVWGIDFNTNVHWQPTGVGSFVFNLATTYLGSFEETRLPGARSVDIAGKDGRPRWRGQGTLRWNKASYQASLTVNYTDGYERVLEGADDDHVGSFSTVDAQLNWSPPAIKGSTVSVGINNLFDAAVPEDPYLEGWPFFNRDLYSPRGRFFYARYKHAF